MALVIVHPFWPSSSTSISVGAIEGNSYSLNLVSLINSQSHVALYESRNMAKATRRLLQRAGARAIARTIYTLPNKAELENEESELEWLASFEKQPLLCAGGLYTIYNKSAPEEFAGDCLGTTMGRLTKYGYDCILQPKAAFNWKSLRQDSGLIQDSR
jgi:hypothetical protein